LGACEFLLHQYERRGAIGDAGRIAGRDAAVGAKHRRQLGELVERRVGARMLVALDAHLAAARVARGHRRDFGCEVPRGPGGTGAPLRFERIGILCSAIDAIALRQLFGRLAHDEPGERIEKTILKHRVDERAVAHAITGAGAVEQIWHARHVLHATHHNGACFAETDRLRTEQERLESGSARLVDREGGDAIRQAGAAHDLARRIGPATGDARVTEDDFVDARSVDARGLQRGARCRRPQLDRRGLGESTEEAPDGRAPRGGDHDLMHGQGSLEAAGVPPPAQRPEAVSGYTGAVQGCQDRPGRTRGGSGSADARRGAWTPSPSVRTAARFGSAHGRDPSRTALGSSAQPAATRRDATPQAAPKML
jgi:hypothetical protein